MRIELTDRGVIALEGTDAATLLQGIVTNDVRRLGDATEPRALYAALLTPQGKYLFDFFLLADQGRILIDCRAEDREALLRRLMLYRLRAKVEIRDVSDDFRLFAQCEAVNGDEPGRQWREDGMIVAVDPRGADLGRRHIVPRDRTVPAPEAGPEAYRRHLILAGVPEPALDAERERTLALELGLDWLNGVDFAKGCYVGQEITARTHWRGKVRKRLLGIRFEGPPPEEGSAVAANGTAIGTICGATEGGAIALLRTETLPAPALHLEDGRSAWLGVRARALLDADAKPS
ncbi:MAG: folate-binding protein YgfZ [Rhodothalassiaceae bacterium]